MLERAWTASLIFANFLRRAFKSGTEQGQVDFFPGCGYVHRIRIVVDHPL
jgi:hypothetical protein